MTKTNKGRYLTIGKVCKQYNLKTYTLRYWEVEVDALKPLYVEGRRFYDEKQVKIIEKLKFLIIEKGLTVKAAGQAVKHNNFKINAHVSTGRIQEELNDVLVSLGTLLNSFSDDVEVPETR
ncbi:MAG TPA: MerR family transcriptional regulator [Gammaproteobacteria bacterium]|nr:MerR family transcriptional regulator [Gammaproteobacteria bacterium]